MEEPVSMPPRPVTPVSVADAIACLQEFNQACPLVLLQHGGGFVPPYFQFDGENVEVLPQTPDDYEAPDYPPNGYHVSDVINLMREVGSPTTLVYSKDQGLLYPPTFSFNATVAIIRHRKMSPPNTMTTEDVIRHLKKFPTDALVYFVNRGVFYAPKFTYKNDSVVISIGSKEDES